MQLRFTLHGTVWAALYLFFVLGPLFALLAGRLPPARDFWTEFAVAIGYAGLAMMGLQFGLTARFRYVTEPWGEDVIYHFHRQISLVAVGLVATHALIMFATRPEMLALTGVGDVPLGAVFAMLSLASLIVLVVTALWRAKLKIRYETWHLTHIVLAVVAVAGGVAHMVGWAFYLTDPWKRALWIGLTIFWIGLLFYVRIVKPLFMLRRPYRVAEVREERGDARTLVMRPDGHAGFRFTPGQFGWLTLWAGPFRITGHPFSFSSSAAVADGRVEMTIRNLGDFTSRIAGVPVGERVYLDGPYGAFTIDRNPADMHVLIAGGVGITPMMSMLRTLADRGRQAPGDPALRQQGLGLDHLPRRARVAEVAARPEGRPRAAESAGRLDGREGLHRRRDVQAPPAAAVRRPRILHLRPGRDDGCDRESARRAARAAREVPFRAL